MVSQWESDTSIPTTQRLLLLRKRVKFSIDWVLTGEDEQHPAYPTKPIQHVVETMLAMDIGEQYLVARLADQVSEPKEHSEKQ